MAALEAGKHVSLQKPLAVNLAETDGIVAGGSSARTACSGCCENFRYYPPYIRAKELLDAGAIGEPLSMRVKVIGGKPRGGWRVPARTWGWRFNEAQCGGGPRMLDHGYHMFSIVMYFLGPVEKVFAWIERQEVARTGAGYPSRLMWKHREGGALRLLGDGGLGTSWWFAPSTTPATSGWR